MTLACIVTAHLVYTSEIWPVCSWLIILLLLLLSLLALINLALTRSIMLQAFQVVTWAHKATVAVLAVTALLGAAAVGAGTKSFPVWGGLGAGAVVAALVAWQLGVLRQKFIFVDYVHAEH